jgi:hypothetical protein
MGEGISVFELAVAPLAMEPCPVKTYNIQTLSTQSVVVKQAGGTSFTQKLAE